MEGRGFSHSLTFQGVAGISFLGSWMMGGMRGMEGGRDQRFVELAGWLAGCLVRNRKGRMRSERGWGKQAPWHRTTAGGYVLVRGYRIGLWILSRWNSQGMDGCGAGNGKDWILLGWLAGQAGCWVGGRRRRRMGMRRLGTSTLTSPSTKVLACFACFAYSPCLLRSLT